MPTVLYGSQPTLSPYFTGRESEIVALAFALSTQRTTPSLTALCGMGGVGKTQVVLEYVRRYAPLYKMILWFNASSRDVLRAEVSTLAEKLALSRQNRF